MGTIGKVAVGGGGAAVLAAAAAVGISTLRFRRQVVDEVGELFRASRGGTPTPLEESEIAALPEPVQRWLRRAGVVGQPRPLVARLKQEGFMRRGPGQPPLPVRAEQYFTTDPPGFVWIPTMWMGPVWVAGRDRYINGRGAMDMLLLSIFPVLRARGPELDQGTLLRYLTETIWFPATVLSPYITWEAGDTTSARATMDFGGVRATATFTFDEAGDVVSTSAERYRETGGHFELHRWSIPVSEYGVFAGVRMPTAGSATWHLPSGDLPYYDWRITHVEYHRASMYGVEARTEPTVTGTPPKPARVSTPLHAGA